MCVLPFSEPRLIDCIFFSLNLGVFSQFNRRTNGRTNEQWNQLGACGRAGESAHALRLFQNMKEEGLSPDRVAYNALFSAMRVARDPDTVSKCGKGRGRVRGEGQSIIPAGFENVTILKHQSILYYSINFHFPNSGI